MISLSASLRVDPVHPLRIYLQGPFRKTVTDLTPDQETYNKAMSQVRTSMELIFRDIIKYFASFDYKKRFEDCSAVAKM